MLLACAAEVAYTTSSADQSEYPISMTLLLVILIRLLVPLTILKWHLMGPLLSIAADASDVVLFDALGGPSYMGGAYHTVDKLFDMYYLSFMLYVSFRWTEPLEKQTAIILYGWRLLGIALFEVTRARQLIFLAPNIFENFYLLVVGVRRSSPQFRVNNRDKLMVVLLIVGVPKLIQEYFMHYLEFP